MPGGKLAKKDNVDQKHNPLCLRKAGVLNLGFEARAPLQEAHIVSKNAGTAWQGGGGEGTQTRVFIWFSQSVYTVVCQMGCSP